MLLTRLFCWLLNQPANQPLRKTPSPQTRAKISAGVAAAHAHRRADKAQCKFEFAEQAIDKAITHFSKEVK
jgi:hypothetical protein